MSLPYTGLPDTPNTDQHIHVHVVPPKLDNTPVLCTYSLAQVLLSLENLNHAPNSALCFASYMVLVQVQLSRIRLKSYTQFCSMFTASLADMV